MPVSAALIVKNDPRLARAVESIRPHVDEVCIVDTGSTDGTAELAASLADKFEVFTGCNFADGEIADFSAARTRSFDLASHETVLWLDSDDVLEGADKLREAIAWAHANSKGGQPWRLRFPYAYDHDASGACISWQLRERVVHPRSQFHWVYRVHEGLTCKLANEWLTLDPPQPIVWRHELDRSKPRSRRNLRILRDVLKTVGPGKVDLKTVFDMGAEYAKSGDHARALAWLSRYVAESDLDDDRALACLFMVDVLSFWPGREQDAAVWAHRATEIKPDWAEGHWALAKIAYSQAARDGRGERRHLERAVHFARKGLDLPPTQTPVATNPLDRTLNVHAILADACARLGDYAGASKATAACCEARPDDVALALKRREYELQTKAHAGLDIVIACGITAEAWDPWVASNRGIGGSETAVIEMGRRLAAAGARVRVFCRCDRAGLYDDVEYRPMGEIDQAAGCDILIAWRNATLLETTSAHVKWLWLHDTDAFGPTAWNLTLADRVLCLSNWHAQHIAKKHPAVADRITVTRNGIDVERFAALDVERVPTKAIFSSSPDRGLDQVLDMWPQIAARVPGAELHCFYGMAALPKDRSESIRARLESTPSVVWRDRVDQQTLAREMLSTGVWLHPSWSGDGPFFETSCIGAMEAQAAGCRIVAATHGALSETASLGALIPGDATSPDFQYAFANAVVLAMTAKDDADRSARQATARKHFDWATVAEQWLELADIDLAARPMVDSVSASIDRRPVLHMILAPQASGDLAIDAAYPGNEAHGGGSRAGFMGLVEAMAKLGTYRVQAFSTFLDLRVRRGDAEYIRLDRLSAQPDPDVAVAYYDTSPLARYDGAKTLRIASHHTYAPYMHFDSADVNTAPSQHAVDALRSKYDPTGIWYVLPNAVGEMAVERRPIPGQILYHTSPDRGLDVLLRAFPRIRRAVPHATLRVVGAVQQIVDSPDVPGRFGEIARLLRAALADAGDGVTLLGRLPRARLLDELATASVFAFPCAPIAPCETFSISVMECCKIGLPVVLAPADALESIYRGAVRVAPEPARQHVEEFADAVIAALTSDTEQSQLAAAGKALASRFTFDRAALALDSIVRAHGVSTGHPFAACAE